MNLARRHINAVASIALLAVLLSGCGESIDASIVVPGPPPEPSAGGTTRMHFPGASGGRMNSAQYTAYVAISSQNEPTVHNVRFTQTDPVIDWIQEVLIP